jgi:tetratricopeptide (TPR) repeat protein
MPVSEAAQAYKEKGNQFYKASSHLQGMVPRLHCFVFPIPCQLTLVAIEQYQLATKADPKEPLLFFNLSAAQYEAGFYEDCIKSLDHAVSLCNPKEHEELLSKLWLRRAKCQFNLGVDLASAGASAKKAAALQKGLVAIKKDANAVQEAAGVFGFYKELLLEVEVLGMVMDLPKYRPSL